MKVLVLVDGEHYPPVTRWGIASAKTMGHEVLAAVFVGGTEKTAPGALPELGVPVVDAREDTVSALSAAIEDLRPEGVLDLSDEPVLGYRERMRLASTALFLGVAYLGSAAKFDPAQASLFTYLALVGRRDAQNLLRSRGVERKNLLKVVELSAADGAWLSYVTTGQTRMSADLRAVHAGLLAQTYRRA